LENLPDGGPTYHLTATKISIKMQSINRISISISKVCIDKEDNVYD
jgi:hypothetical protein